ncbi:ABC transporter ATP-binding protein [Enterococcus lemanii]|uniref:ABC transporter ATP-binding protein n=1 Tax=Enterococcus lemanii TaxID=1159752 RepID=A0ABV9MSX3_9ENTE|nr:ABC transporter ATP-binding protein [Enterococcus lemanii]MBM7708852.1 putative hydroxymethylpyrimidine transport system ATP-binding protein [Enterococcus lemanii]
MIVVENLSFQFPQNAQPTFSALDLTIQDNEFLTIIGKSGCGKSTLLRVLAGLLPASSGEIKQNQTTLTRLQVGYMPQKDTLLPWKTVQQNIQLGQAFDSTLQISQDVLNQGLKQAGLWEYRHRLPNELSGGMKQRAAFLRTLMTQRSVLMLDEPFGALDRFTRSQMQAWLVGLWEERKKTVILISHDLEEALLLSDKIALMTSTGLEIFSVNLPRPRQMNQRFSPAFVKQREKLERILITNGA